MMKGVMIQGTASDVGKSLIVTALCKLFSNEGVKTAPFKSQNMSNNSYVTIDGSEIGRAQGIQAEAARTEATVWMNPILLKPQSDQDSEVVLLGKPLKTLSGSDYRELFYEEGIKVIESALRQLEKNYELLILEGAGSPVEMNLKDRELVNMKVAEMADVPVFLVADIDRGGIFASIVGTIELLTKEERKRVKGIIINKFRGDFQLFNDGVKWIEHQTGIPVLGVLPYIHNHMIDAEDSLAIEEFRKKKKNGELEIAVIQLPYSSNISDIEPFLYEEDVCLRFVRNGHEFGRPDAIILPGTKSTINDLQFLKENGLFDKILHFVHNGGFIVGICGGYQMLGKELIDESGVDTKGKVSKESGLSILDAITYFRSEKQTIRVRGNSRPQTGFKQVAIEGYEIHYGDTILLNETTASRLFQFESGRVEGYYGMGGRIVGTYLHHLFHNDDWRNQWLNRVRKSVHLPLRDKVNIGNLKEQRFELLASEMEKHLQWEKIKQIVSEWEGLNSEDD